MDNDLIVTLLGGAIASIPSLLTLWLLVKKWPTEKAKVESETDKTEAEAVATTVTANIAMMNHYQEMVSMVTKQDGIILDLSRRINVLEANDKAREVELTSEKEQRVIAEKRVTVVEQEKKALATELADLRLKSESTESELRKRIDMLEKEVKSLQAQTTETLKITIKEGADDGLK